MGKGIPGGALGGTLPTEGVPARLRVPPANLFIDRHDQYIGYGPEARELVGLPDVETFCVLPWGPEGGPGSSAPSSGSRETDDPGGYLTSELPRQPEAGCTSSFTADTGLHCGRVRTGDDVAEDPIPDGSRR